MYNSLMRAILPPDVWSYSCAETGYTNPHAQVSEFNFASSGSASFIPLRRSRLAWPAEARRSTSSIVSSGSTLRLRTYRLDDEHARCAGPTRADADRLRHVRCRPMGGLVGRIGGGQHEHAIAL